MSGRAEDWARRPAHRQNKWVFGLLAATFALAAALQLQMPTNHDHSWQFFLARELLGGARLYVDVGPADMHPPLFTWLATALEKIAQLLDVYGPTLYTVFVLITIAASIAAAWKLGVRSPVLVAALILALVAWPGLQFGQGDHLAVIWSLPYLIAASRPFDGRNWAPGPLARGCAAGLGMAMKPHFALLWVAVEVQLARRHGWRSLSRPESLSVLFIFVAYVALTALFTPEFFGLTWVPGLYARFSPAQPGTLILNGATVLLGVAALVIRRLDENHPQLPLARIFLTGAAALFVAAALQLKGWSYHWIPSQMLSIAALAAAIPHLGASVTAAVSIGSLILLSSSVFEARRGEEGPPHYQADIAPLVDRYSSFGPYLVLAENGFAAFPLVTDRGIGWASPYLHLWMIPALYPEFWTGPPRYKSAEQWTAIEKDMADRIWRRASPSPPSVILLQTTRAGFHFGRYFSADPRFADLLARYVELAPIGPYRVLLRDDLAR